MDGLRPRSPYLSKGAHSSPRPHTTDHPYFSVIKPVRFKNL